MKPKLKPTDVCECGDFRIRHSNQKDECNTFKNGQWCKCPRFRRKKR